MSKSKEKKHIEKNGWNNLSLDERNDWELQKQRIIVIVEEFNEYMARDIITKLEVMDEISDEPVKIIIDSVGGSTADGFAIVGTIEQMRSHVITEARGLAASMGLFLLMAGDERRATRHTRFLLHEVSMGSRGYMKVGEWDDDTTELKNHNEMLADYVVEKSKLSKSKLKKLWTRRDFWCNAETALDLGFIDEVM